MVKTLPLDDDTDAEIFGNTAYESSVVEHVCEEKGLAFS